MKATRPTSEIAPTAELLHAQMFRLHASGGAKVQSKSAAARAASCWKLRTPKRTTCSCWHICAAKILHSPESLQSHCGPFFSHCPMGSGLSAAIDVDCSITFMGLEGFTCEASRVSNSATLIQEIVDVILHASCSSCSKHYSHPMLIGLKFHLPETSPPETPGPESRACH